LSNGVPVTVETLVTIDGHACCRPGKGHVMDNSMSINPHGSALLVLDMQKIILEGDAAPPSAAEKDALLSRTARLIAAVRGAGMRVIYVRNGFRRGYPEVSGRNKSFDSIRKRDRFPDDGDGSQIHPAVAPHADDVVITKHRVNAFFGTELDMILRANGIETLILVGIATSRVVLSTLRYAADADYGIVVAHDCCSDSDPDVHEMLIKKVFVRAATAVTSDAVLEALGRR
jgi:nicotinamidase-related amidase